MPTRVTFLTAICMTLLLVGMPVLAEPTGKPLEVQKMNSLTYHRFADGWYSMGVHGLFKVDQTTVTARILSNDSRAAIDTMLDAHQLQLIRENHLGIMDIRVPAGGDPLELVAELKDTGLFRYVETNSIGRWVALANDPYFDNQWGHYNTGQTGGTADADIDCSEAWDVEKGDPAVVVAILDSGTDTDHEDLIGNMWNNVDEVPGNSTDDDNNGYIDDIVGWDFEFDDNDPNGTYFHGTHVAGIVAATSNNGIGVAGVAGGWGAMPGAQLMPLLVGSDGPIGAILDDAIMYAADNGAQVITMSLSVETSQAIIDAADYAQNTKHAFVDCASGNDSGAITFPANVASISAIGATDHNDALAYFSNFGSELELTAPGVDIWSTGIGNTYDTSDGTSFSAPYVAGVAALVFSVAPNMNGVDVKTLLHNTADDLGTTGWDQYFGHGRVNAAAALAAVSGIYLDRNAYPCQSAISVRVRDSSASGSIQIVLSSDTETVGEPVTLTETNPGVFEGSFQCDNVAVMPGDDILSVSEMDTITAYYPSLDKSDTAPVDCSLPVISNVAVGGTADTWAMITWTTDEPTDSTVSYGIGSLTEMSYSGTVTTFHSVTLTGLDQCSDFLFEVISADPAGNAVTDDNSGAFYTFTTYERVKFLNENMDTDPGWSMDSNWSFGSPAGQGGQYGNPDPDSGYTGSNVYGNNLNGDYPNSMPQTYYLTTSAFDCSETDNVTFQFQGWLGVEGSTYDHAYIEVSGDGGSTWDVIWENSGTLEAGSWELWDFDISPYAAGNSSVMIRWGIGGSDSSWQYCGWNIDDVVMSFTTPCTGTCNNDGDVNLNGEVTAADAQLSFFIALGQISPTPAEECAADCNGDGEVTAGDAQAIFNLALGIGTCADSM